MNDVEFAKQLRWITFCNHMMKSDKSYTVCWGMPDGSVHHSSSCHPILDELIDFSRRSMIEKIGCAAVATHFTIHEFDSEINHMHEKAVYDSRKSQ